MIVNSRIVLARPAYYRGEDPAATIALKRLPHEVAATKSNEAEFDVVAERAEKIGAS
jgi:hypothetical protein